MIFLARKSNKFLKLEFRRLTDPTELEQVLDNLIAYYDFRQGALNPSNRILTSGDFLSTFLLSRRA